MRKILLAIMFAFASLYINAQVVANPVPDLVQCNSITFDLTTQIPGIIGSQSEQSVYVMFYQTEADAVAGVNPIANPSAYTSITTTPANIFARVNSTTEDDFDVTSFMLIVNGPVLPFVFNVTACGSYTFPALENGNYYTGPGGTGNIIPAGTTLTATATIFVYAESTNGCSAEESFTVTIVNDIPVTPLPPIVTCDLENGYGYGAFVLGYSAEEFMLQNPGTTDVGFFLTLEQDGSLSDEIPFNYFINTVAHGQIVYLYYWDACGEHYIPVELVVEQCDEDQAGLTGVVTIDDDNNGCDANDLPASGIMVVYNHNNDVYYTFTNSEGKYYFYNVPAGNATVWTQNVNGQTYIASPESVNVTVPANQSAPIVNDFCLTVPAPYTDVAAYVYAAWGAVPGFTTGYYVNVWNYGTESAGGTVSLTFDPALVSIIDADGGFVGSNTITWNYSGLAPLNSLYKYVIFSIAQPPTVVSGTVLPYTVVATTLTTDTDTANNTYTLNQVAVNSYDPNDITVREGESITLAQAAGYLHYTVRFQNTGTAPAQKVRITLPLDEKFNTETFQPIGSSHNYEVHREGNNVEFVFNNIQLPYEDIDEAGSNGFVSFRIKLLPNVVIGDSMSETANIYFDFNEPIVTNTATTTIEAVSAVGTVSAKAFVLYPNPAAAQITIKLNDPTEAQLSITDVLGKKVLSQQVTDKQNVNVSHLTDGVYFVNVTTGGKTSVEKLIIRK